jgi:glycyl-tRNA synthetase beta chain
VDGRDKPGHDDLKFTADHFSMTGELLLELLSEEIPARMQRRAIEDLTGLIRDKLAAADIPAPTIEGHVTPRRLVVIADGIPARQPDRSEERRGPRVGSPEAAIGGFLRGAGLKSIDECEVRATDRGEFYFAVLKQPGRATAEVLPELILAAMTALPWPKSMRYPASSLRWVRPLNSVVCLLDGDVIDLPLGDVPVGRVTRGHRFLAPGEITVESAADYRAKLARAHVVLDRTERHATIDEELTALARANGLTVKPDQGLLEEVTGLVEYPVVLMGDIDADFVRPLPEGLPPEVLATAMRTHQKYFTCLNPDGTPAPRFLFVANNVTPDGGKTIAAGNERVLRARLSDARFFWDQDRKIRLEDRVEALKQRVYHEKLGSVYDKVERMEKLAEYLAGELHAQFVAPAKAGAQGQAKEQTPLDSRFRGNDDGEAFKGRCVRAARLTKADLSTGMIGEFPELQGIVGRYYALNDNEDPRVADAIANHYKPLGPNDTCPIAPESIVVALADKIDALAAFFAVGERPTGSGDPYALRRAALGVIRVILENKLKLTVADVLTNACVIYFDQKQQPVAYVHNDVLNFMIERLKIHLRSQNVRHDLIAAAFARSASDLGRLLECVSELNRFLGTEDGLNLLTAYRRAANIVGIEEQKDAQSYDKAPDQSRFSQPEEGVLDTALLEARRRTGSAISDERFSDAMAALATLRHPVDEFFERVTVNVPDKELRENRLRLLARIRATMNQIADFSQIEG